MPNYTEYPLGTDSLTPSEGIRVSTERNGKRVLKVPLIPDLRSQVEWADNPFDRLGWIHLTVLCDGPFYLAVGG